MIAGQHPIYSILAIGTSRNEQVTRISYRRGIPAEYYTQLLYLAFHPLRFRYLERRSRETARYSLGTVTIEKRQAVIATQQNATRVFRLEIVELYGGRWVW